MSYTYNFSSQYTLIPITPALYVNPDPAMQIQQALQVPQVYQTPQAAQIYQVPQVPQVLQVSQHSTADLVSKFYIPLADLEGLSDAVSLCLLAIDHAKPGLSLIARTLTRYHILPPSTEREASAYAAFYHDLHLSICQVTTFWDIISPIQKKDYGNVYKATEALMRILPELQVFLRGYISAVQTGVIVCTRCYMERPPMDLMECEVCVKLFSDAAISEVSVEEARKRLDMPFMN